MVMLKYEFKGCENNLSWTILIIILEYIWKNCESNDDCFYEY